MSEDKSNYEDAVEAAAKRLQLVSAEHQSKEIVQDHVSEQEYSVLIMSVDEVYLVHGKDETGKPILGRRICGAPLQGTRETKQGIIRQRCRAAAGTDTTHVGEGRCGAHQHLPISGRPPGLLLRLMKSNGALRLREMLELEQEQLRTEDMASLDEEVMLLSALISTAAEEGHYASVAELIDKMRLLKQTRHTMELQLNSIDPRSIKLFMQSFFSVLRKKVPADKYVEIITALEDNVYIPVTQQFSKAVRSLSDKVVETTAVEVEEEKESSNE